MGCGIYKIINTIDSKVYIGSSIEIDVRLKKHKYMLKANNHHNTHLQNAVNRDGLDKFKFEIIEFCDKNILSDRENFYIDLFDSLNSLLGYNLATVSKLRKNNFNLTTKIQMSKTKIKNNGNFKTFKLINISSGDEILFDNLVEAADYLINNKFTNSVNSKIRGVLSNCLRGKKINNGLNGSVRRTIFNHKWAIIN